MDKNYIKLNHSSTRMKIYMFRFKLMSIILCLILSINCKSKLDKKNIINLNYSGKTNLKWDDLFNEHIILPFKFKDPSLEIYTVGDMTISSKGHFFISDGKAGKIIRFDSAGNFVQYVGGKGEGPGEFTYPQCLFLDNADNFYLFNTLKMTIIKYVPPNYKYEKITKIQKDIQDLIVTENGEFLTYTVSERQKLFKFNSEGKVLKKKNPVQRSLNSFLGRFHIGRMSHIPEIGLLFFYPLEYKIYFFDFNYNLKKVFQPENISEFFPPKVKFPNDLSPFTFTRKHAKWWGKYYRIGEIFNIDNQTFIMVLIKYTNLSAEFRVNIHNLDGNTYCTGLNIPFDGIIRYASDGYIYVVQDSEFDKNNNILPLKIHRYKFRKNVGHN